MRRQLAGAIAFAAVLAAFAPSAVADPTWYFTNCRTYAETAGYQADYLEDANWSPGNGWYGQSTTNGTTSGQPNDQCLKSAMTVEASLIMERLSLTYTSIGVCQYQYDSQTNGGAEEIWTCAHQSGAPRMRYYFGHRAWWWGVNYDRNVSTNIQNW